MNLLDFLHTEKQKKIFFDQPNNQFLKFEPLYGWIFMKKLCVKTVECLENQKNEIITGFSHENLRNLLPKSKSIHNLRSIHWIN